MFLTGWRPSWKALLGILALKGQVSQSKTSTLCVCVEVISHLILGALPGTHFLIHFSPCMMSFHNLLPHFIKLLLPSV